ncbi:MAG: polysaccharide deacetylase family protein [Armatimonadota bacterium]|nr:polysaccharide deacetylase family protein [Armatimonadota bacterium]MDR7456667.1 polysaccharide deacetylase family protein [Armatimonadota bacterium]
MIRGALAAWRRRVRRPRRAAAPRALILLYHRIGEPGVDPWGLTVTPARLAQHLDALRRSRRVVPLHELLERLRRGEGRLAAVTFDDGYSDALTQAAPRLADAGVPATVFVTTGALDRPAEHWWDTLAHLVFAGALPTTCDLELAGRPFRMSLEAGASGDHAEATDGPWRAWEPPPGPREALYRALYDLLLPLRELERRRALDALHAWAGVAQAIRASHRLLTAAELRDLARRDHIEIGAHTVTHPWLAAQSVADQAAEIAGSRQAIERVIERPVTAFAYPYGRTEHYTRQTVRLVRRAGFALACANVPGPVDAGTDPFQLPRLQVQNWGVEEFAARLLNLT